MIESRRKWLGDNLCGKGMREERTIQSRYRVKQSKTDKAFPPKALRSQNLRSCAIYGMQEASHNSFSMENSWGGFDISSYKERTTAWGGFWPLEKKNTVLNFTDQKEIYLP